LALDVPVGRDSVSKEDKLMRKLLFVLALFLFGSATAFAQNVGEKLPDEKGVFFTFDNGHRANVRIADHKLQIVFLNEKNLVEQSPYKRAIVRVDRLHANDDDLVLAMNEDPSVPYLTHSRFIQPPLSFRIRVIFYPDAESDEGKVAFPITFFRWELDDSGDTGSIQ
jgi:hypothetical protein